MSVRTSSTLTVDTAAVMRRASGENFPVASRLLGGRARAHLLAIYGFARLVDEVGDGPIESHRDGSSKACEDAAVDDRRESSAGSASAREAQARLAALDELEADLDRAFNGHAQHPLLQRLQPTLRACALPREPFVRLIEANRVDQRVARYETWEQLRGYCALSANPVGELVLGVFGQADPANVALSDEICTALQLVEHCQDVAEDLARGRVYLPVEDLARFGCRPDDLRAPHAGDPLRAAISFEVRRARELLDRGAPLIGRLHGARERFAVSAFVAGGRAALDAIEGAGCDVLAGPPKAGSARRLLALARTLAERRARTKPAAHAERSAHGERSE